MLRQLAIRNVVLVESLELEFDSGLGVLTGETGAGKSILLDSLGLALGARADVGLVRSGEDAAAVSAELQLPADHPVHELLAEQGIEPRAWHPIAEKLRDDELDRLLGMIREGVARNVAGLPDHEAYVARYCGTAPAAAA